MTSPSLTISMATFDDFDGVFFSVQSIRMHQDLPEETEFLILDNNPDSAHGKQLKHFAKDVPGMRVVDVTDRKSSFVKYDAFKLAKGDIILGLDCHVLLQTGFIKAMMEYWSWNAKSKNMLTGPLIYDSLKATSEQINPVWRGHDFGIWGDNKEGMKSGEPFEIPAQGMGCFSFVRANAPEINQGFRGFGGEEWYMAEKVRRNGGVVVCHPKMGWNHRFNWPIRTFPLTIEDKLHNYYTGWLEIYGNINHPMMVEMTKHWVSQVGEDIVKTAIFKAVLGNAFMPPTVPQAD
jgi:hypothetical protein